MKIMKIVMSMLMMCSLMVSTSTATTIEYALDGGWTYEQYSNTLLLSDNPLGGVTATINVPSGIEDGGLIASRHSLLGFSLNNFWFIALEYSSLSSTVTGNAAYLDLNLELEFFNSESSFFQIGMNISQSAESVSFESWFEKDLEFDFFVDAPVPDAILTNQGALGLYVSDDRVIPYFEDAAGNQTFPFLGWNISQIIGAKNFGVDNDFEAYTLDGGSVLASVNLERVVYGVVPEPTSLLLFASGIIGVLSFLKKRA